MEHSTNRTLTTHCGSLARPRDLLDLMKAKLNGQPYDAEAYEARVRSAIAEVVRRQVETGVDVVNDGEQSKPGFFPYVRERLAGFEPRAPRNAPTPYAEEVAALPEYYEDYFARAMLGGGIAPRLTMVCTGPVTYRGHEAVQRDIENLKAALAGLSSEEVFMPAVAPSGIGFNEYYPTDEAYLRAVAEAMRTEYQGIVDAGFILQIDDPWLTEFYSRWSPTKDRRATAEMHVAALNHALRGIPPDKVRFHTCYGINEGPRVHDTPLQDIVEIMLKVNAGAYSFEAANPRQEHEYHVWEKVKLSPGRVLIPGVISHASNIVEHPELIAERISRYAKLVGRENVIAGSDCGFSSMATYNPEVHPAVVWAKFEAMAEGARRATKELWGR